MPDVTDGTPPIGLKWEIKRRLTRPFSSLRFILYFIFMVIGVAGMGVYLPNAWKWWDNKPTDWSSLPNDLSTYELALLATAVVDMLLSEDKLHKDLKLILYISLIFVPLMTALIITNPSHVGATTFASVLTIYALIVWWISSADKDVFTESTEELQRAALGNEKQKPAGTLKGYNS